MFGPCAKQVVTATIVTPTGERFVGTNDCRAPQTVCPRGDLPSGVGYDLCRDVCDQTGHAEVNAIRAAGPQARGAKLYLEGHSYACGDCRCARWSAGIVDIFVSAPPQC